MRQTVFGLFNTYAEADGARNALMESGFAFQEVELRANPETASDAIADESPGVLANIERFFASLFSTSGATASEPIVEHYTQAVRRGAVLVSVDAASDSHAELAHNTLMRLGARDLSERPFVSPQERDDARHAEQARREHSMLDELGIGGPAALPTAAQPPREPLRAMEEERRFERVDAPPHDSPIDDEAARTAIAAGGAPGSGAVLRPDLADTGRRELDDAAIREAEAARSAGVQPARPVAPAPSAPPRDEFSRVSGGGLGADFEREATGAAGVTRQSSPKPSMPPERAEDSAYPARAVQGAAQYQSDPSDIGRATSLPGHGLWQREAVQGSEPQQSTGAAQQTRAPDFGVPTNRSVRDEHQPPQMGPDADAPPDTARAARPDRDPSAARSSGAPDQGTVRGTGHSKSDPGAVRSSIMPDEGVVRDPDQGRGGPSAVLSSGTPDESVLREAGRNRGDPSAVRSSGTPDERATRDPGMRGQTATELPGMTDEYEARQNLADSSGLGAPIPDEFLEYEEDFRTHYDAQYRAREGARYDEYVPAYRYGAQMGRDTRYQDRPWEEDVELEARHDWERTAAEGSWDRFKAAVRHGWERVTGHHHHH